MVKRPKAAIGNVPTAGVSPELRQFLGQTKELLEILASRRGSDLDGAVTWRDLVDEGIVSVRNPRFGQANYVTNVSSPFTNTATPPAITGLTAVTTLENIFLDWNFPDDLRPYLRFFEVWRHTADVQGSAVLHGVTSATIYVDTTAAHNTDYYYWVRAVTFAGVVGPFQAVNGAHANLGVHVANLLTLLDGSLTESELHADLNARLDLVDYPVTGLMDRFVAEQNRVDLLDIANEALVNAARAEAVTLVDDEETARETAVSTETAARIAAISAEAATRLASLASLDAKIDSVAASLGGSMFHDFEASAIDLWIDETGSTSINDGDAISGSYSGKFTWTGGAAPAALTGGSRFAIPATSRLTFINRTVRVSIYAKQPPSGAAASFKIAYTIDDGSATTSGWQTFNPNASQFGRHFFEFAVPAGTGPYEHYIEVLGDGSGAGGAVLLDALIVENVTSEGELSGISANAAAISALDSRVTTNEGSITSLSSSVTALQSDLTVLEGNGGILWRYQGANVTVPTSTTIAGAQELLFESPLNEEAVLAVKGYDFEGFVHVALNGLDLGTMSGNSLETKWYEFDVTLLTGTNSLKIWSTTGDGGQLRGAEAYRLPANTKGSRANALAISSLQTSITNNANGITAAGSRLDALEATVNNGTTGVAANAAGIDSLETVVYDGTTGVAALASRTTALESTVNNGTTGVVATATALAALDTRVTAAEGVNTSQASAITALQSDLSTSNGNITANASAISALDTRVTATESDISSQAGQITALSATLDQRSRTFIQGTSPTAENVGDRWINTADSFREYYWDGDSWDPIDTRIGANATAISQLDTRVTQTESDITAQAGDITALQTSVGTANSNIASNASAISALDTRVTATETTNTSQATSITSLQATVAQRSRTFIQGTQPTAENVGDRWINSADAYREYYWDGASWGAIDTRIGSNATAISQLDTRVTQTEADIVAQAGDITALESSVNAANSNITSNASAISALDTRVTATESTNTSQASSITSLQSTVAQRSRTFIQGTAPTAENVGDRWINSADNYREKYWSGSAWTDIDTRISSNASAITALDTRVTATEATNASQASSITAINASLTQRSRTFIQGTSPTAENIGDRWINTSDSNKEYYWNGSAWTTIDTRISANASAISALDVRVTDNEGDISSQASTITTLNSTVGSHSTTLTTHGSSISGLEGKYTVKIDNNGYVTGYGLASVANNGTPVSEFAIVADKFSIAPVATDHSASDGSPFFHLTAPTVIGGVSVPAGTYMKAAYIHDASIINAKIANGAIDSAKIVDASILNAKIANAAITEGKIADLQVTTLKIGNNAVSIPTGAYTTGILAIATGGTYTTVQTVSLTSTGAPIMVIGSMTLLSSGSTHRGVIRVRVNSSTIIYNGEQDIDAGGSSNFSFAVQTTPGAGSVTITMEVTSATGNGQSAAYRSLVAIETKK